MGWERHFGETHLDELRQAEQAAQVALEQNQRSGRWDGLRSMLSGPTEGRSALTCWKAQHGEVDDKAERAALATAVGLRAVLELSCHRNLTGLRLLVTLTGTLARVFGIRPAAEVRKLTFPLFLGGPVS
jgi:hypothetical protein